MANKVNHKHPEHSDRYPEWTLMRHAHRGESAIKAEGELYLPTPSGFRSQKDGGRLMYTAYQGRARFPELVSPMVRGMVGLIHRVEAKIDLPPALNYLWERATADGLPLEAFHRRITREILTTGRYAVLTDVPEGGGGALPYLAGYSTENLINWSSDREFFILDETALTRDGFKWIKKEQYRELLIDGGRYVQRLYEGEDDDKFRRIEPARRGGGFLDKIPLVIISPVDLSLAVVEPPLIGVARAAKAAYQLDADYRHQLYMAGQETLFISGADELPENVGAGVVHGLPENGRAEYVGPSGNGIEAHRKALQDVREEGVNAGIQLFDRQSGQESGEALRLRYGAQTATLTTIAQTSAQALEAALRNAALFMGLPTDNIVVKPNLRFVDTVMTPDAARKLMELWLGRAISKTTLFENLQRGEIINEERSFENEEELIDSQAIDLPTREG